MGITGVLRCLFVCFLNFRNRVSRILSLTFICNLGWDFWPFSQVWGLGVCSTMSDFRRPSFVLGRPCTGWVPSPPTGFYFLAFRWEEAKLAPSCLAGDLREPRAEGGSSPSASPIPGSASLGAWCLSWGVSVHILITLCVISLEIIPFQKCQCLPLLTEAWIPVTDFGNPTQPELWVLQSEPSSRWLLKEMEESLKLPPSISLSLNFRK